MADKSASLRYFDLDGSIFRAPVMSDGFASTEGEIWDSKSSTWRAISLPAAVTWEGFEISESEAHLSLSRNGRVATPQARKLFDALMALGVKAELEYFDGHKTVDIAIRSAKIYIEVDGIHHFNKADQIERDFKRNHFSDGDDFNTFYVTNQILEKHTDEVAEALAEVVRRRTS